MSAHADSREILRWLGAFKSAPKTSFIVHGEPVAMNALNEQIREKLGWVARMPQLHEVVTLE
jgi:metallo-beta-lactamase family protein